MTSSVYTFSTPLRDAVIKGTYTRTALGQLFGDKVYEKTGIKVFYANSNFDIPQLSGSYIFIYTDIKQLPTYSHGEFRVIQGGYEPQGDLQANILACLQQATKELGLPPISLANNPTITSVFIHDFATTAGSLYFNTNIKSIDQMAKSAFPHLDFMLRFRLCNDIHAPQHYYLIWANEEAEKQAELNGDTIGIISLVENYCQSHDPLGIFATQAISPLVTTKSRLKEQGLVMGIMRENPDFDEW